MQAHRAWGPIQPPWLTLPAWQARKVSANLICRAELVRRQPVQCYSLIALFICICHLLGAFLLCMPLHKHASFTEVATCEKTCQACPKTVISAEGDCSVSRVVGMECSECCVTLEPWAPAADPEHKGRYASTKKSMCPISTGQSE